MSSYLLRGPDLRYLETAFEHAQPPLMQRAGAAAAACVRRLQPATGHPVLILVGPGNNGGDGLVLARHLQAASCPVRVVMMADPARLPADASRAYADWRAAGGQISSALPAPREAFGLIVDALFGIGLSRPLGGVYGEWVAWINRQRDRGHPVLALDCPSGLNADTGEIVGGVGAPVVSASHTLSFIAHKAGLLTLDGPDQCGVLLLDALGLEDEVRALARGRVLSRDDFADLLQARRANSHKGSHGSVAVIGGAPGMAGAALLASRAALHMGAGKVFLGMMERLALDAIQPELMLRDASAALAEATALTLGPGLGQGGRAEELLAQAIAKPVPLCLDADGLNLLANQPVLQSRVTQRQAGTVLTPHPLEAARLLGKSLAAVQADRVETALQLAARFQAAVVLKGNGSVLANPLGDWRICVAGNPGLASGGTGDVLAGLVGGLLAQHGRPWESLCAAVALHGTAADDCVLAGQGPIGLTASELIPAARQRWNAWVKTQTAQSA